MSAFYLKVVVPSVITLPLAMAIYKHKYWKSPERLLFFYLILSGVSNILAVMLGNRNINNLPLLHVYTLLEFCLLSAMFRSFYGSKTKRNYILWIMILFSMLALYDVCFVSSLYTYNSLPRFVSSIVLMLYCLYFLVEDLTLLDNKHSNFDFTVVVGLLLYFSSASTLFAMASYLKNNKGLYMLVWNIHATFVLIMYLIFTAAYLNLKERK